MFAPAAVPGNDTLWHFPQTNHDALPSSRLGSTAEPTTSREQKLVAGCMLPNANDYLHSHGYMRETRLMQSEMDRGYENCNAAALEPNVAFAVADT